MVARQKQPIHRYVDGNAYRPAKGRGQGAGPVEDSRDWRHAMAVVDLGRDQPLTGLFLQKIVRELRIRKSTLSGGNCSRPLPKTECSFSVGC